MRMRNRRRGGGRQSGFSMIEVLIALLVLSFGLLGLALMQTLNLRYTQSAQQRTLAVNLASELLDTMRANRSQLAAYSMDESDFEGLDPEEVRQGCQTYETVTVANNIARWQCEVRESLGAGAYAEVVVAGAPAVAVTVYWTDDDRDNLADSGKIVLETTL